MYFMLLFDYFDSSLNVSFKRLSLFRYEFNILFKYTVTHLLYFITETQVEIENSQVPFIDLV